MVTPPGVTAARAELARDLAAVAAGDRNALARLYEAVSAKLFGVCLRILQDRTAAEEALQETFIAVWTKANQYDPDRASPVTWLAAIARNKALDRLRAKPRAAAPLEAADEVADPAPLASAAVELSEEHRRLQACLDELDPRHGKAIRTAFFDGVTYAALARRADVPIGTMKSWIRRSLLSLRTCLEA